MIEPPGDARERIVVTIDGRPVARAARAVPFFVDPGHHAVALTVDGRAAQQREVALAEGEVATVSLVAPPLPSRASDVLVTTNATAPVLGPPKSRFGHPLVIGGAVVTGVGVAVGAVAGILTMGHVSDARGSCADNVCPPSQYGTLDAGQTSATISTTAFIVAGVGAAVAIGAYLFAPRRYGAPTTAASSNVLPSPMTARFVF